MRNGRVASYRGTAPIEERLRWREPWIPLGRARREEVQNAREDRESPGLNVRVRDLLSDQ
jgi:hypothetical protein